MKKATDKFYNLVSKIRDNHQSAKEMFEDAPNTLLQGYLVALTELIDWVENPSSFEPKGLPKRQQVYEQSNHTSPK